MKKYTTDMAKLIALIIITPVLVMAYTKIESSVSTNAAVQTQVGIPGATPVSIGLMNKIKTAPVDNINTNENNNYMLVRSVWPAEENVFDEAGTSPRAVTTDRFALVLL
jgi:hypothetical protein